MHWKQAKHILHYVQGTREFGIHYLVDAQLYLIGYNDSYWVGDSIDNKSTSGFVFMLGSGPIYWSNKKQATLSISSIEAEYRVVANKII